MNAKYEAMNKILTTSTVGHNDFSDWTEEEFNRRMEGSAIRRIGHQRWLRNIAVALGNAAKQYANDSEIVNALEAHRNHSSELIREHVAWALDQHALSSQQ